MGKTSGSMSVVDLDRCLELATTLIAIPSPSGEEHDVATFLAEYLRQVDGVEVQEIGRANVLATVRGEGGPGPRRLFLTHTDTVAPGGMKDPLDASILDGAAWGKAGKVLRGSGAAAPKGAVAAMVAALTVVARRRESLRGSVQLVAVTEDLKADHAGLKEIVAIRPLEADWAVAGEPSGNTVVVGSRGIVQLQVDVVGTSAHLGRPDEAANPLYGIAAILQDLSSANLPSHPELGSATLAPFSVTSNASPPQSPSRATLLVDRRTLPGEDTTSVVATIAAMAEDACRRTDGLKSDAVALRSMHPFSVAADDSLVVTARAAIAAAIGRDPGTLSIRFSSNAGFAARELGIPSLAFGPGEITDLGPDEHVAVEQVTEAARAYEALMLMDGEP